LAYIPQQFTTRASDWASLVKKTTLYLERNEEEREKWLAETREIKVSDIVYLDESGIDNTICGQYARAPPGKKVFADIKGGKKQRISLIAAYGQQRIVAPMRFEGYCNTEVFNAWLEQCLIPELKKGQTVILDNASFHKSAKTKELIENAGCNIKYLPPYSPDFNPIEQQWAILKARIKKHKTPKQTINQAVDYIFRN